MHTNTDEQGLAFIPFGVGNFLAPLVNGELCIVIYCPFNSTFLLIFSLGYVISIRRRVDDHLGLTHFSRIMDWNFRRVARQIGVPIPKGRTMETRHFPLERVRVPLAATLVLIGNTALLIYVSAPGNSTTILLKTQFL